MSDSQKVKAKRTRKKKTLQGGTAAETVKKLKGLYRSPDPRDLLWHYRVGECVKELVPTTSHQYRLNSIGKLAKELGYSRYYLYFFRQFAVLYDEKSVEELNGKLTWKHIMYLLTIEDAAARKKFAKDAVKHGWSANALDRVVREQIGRRKAPMHGGRNPVKSASVESTLVRIEQLTTPLIRLHTALRRCDEEAEQGSVSGDSIGLNDLPSGIRKSLAKAVNAANRLRDEIEKESQSGKSQNSRRRRR